MSRELDPKRLARFKAWLEEKGYTPRTVRKYVADVVSVVKYDGKPPLAKLRIQRARDYRLAWDVWAAWGKGGELPVERPEVPKPAAWNKSANTRIRGGRSSAEPKRTKEAVSFQRADYKRMVELIEPDSAPAARILLVIARTGLRVGDVLRIPLGVLRAAAKRADGIATLVLKGRKPEVYSIRGGGASERAWMALLAAFQKAPSGWTVAEALMETPGASPDASEAAYERVRKFLERVGAAAKVAGRVHLHRFRRSVAVYLLASGATEDQVRKALGHSSVVQTREYGEEARALESAQLLTRLEKKDGRRR